MFKYPSTLTVYYRIGGHWPNSNKADEVPSYLNALKVLISSRFDEDLAEPCMLDCVGHAVLGVDFDAVRDKK